MWSVLWSLRHDDDGDSGGGDDDDGDDDDDDDDDDDEDVFCTVRTWLHEQDKAHTRSLAQGHRSGWRLCGNVVYEVIESLFILYDFMI